MTREEIGRAIDAYFGLGRDLTPAEARELHELRHARPKYEPPPWGERNEPRPAWPMAAPGEPAWRCVHARTPENMHGPYPYHGGQCLVCRQRARRAADERYLATMSSATRLRKEINDERRRRDRRLAELERRLAEMSGV
jgi:hypothetical protein